MVNEIVDYEINNGRTHGVVSIWHRKIFYSNKNIKKYIENIFDKLNTVRLKITRKAYSNCSVDNSLLRCKSCYHSSKKNNALYCTLFEKYVDDLVGHICIYHSRKIRTTSKPIISKLLKFIEQEGSLDKEKIIKEIAENPNSFSDAFLFDVKKGLNLNEDDIKLYEEDGLFSLSR